MENRIHPNEKVYEHMSMSAGVFITYRKNTIIVKTSRLLFNLIHAEAGFRVERINFSWLS